MSITGVILAGGQGRRMGGVDKGLQPLRGKPLAQWVLERLMPQVSEVLINANQNADRYGEFGHPVIADRIAGFAGPLAGLHAALATASHPLVVTAPCDSPFLPHDLVTRLLAGLRQADADLAVAVTGGRQQPVFCLCRRELHTHLEDYLQQGGRKVDHWYATLRVVEVHFDDRIEAFDNLNTPEQLRELER